MSRQPNPNFESIASDAFNVAKQSGSPLFMKVAQWGVIATSIVTAFAGLAHVVKKAVKDLQGKPHHAIGHSHGDKPPHGRQAAVAAPAPDDHGQGEAKWVERSRAAHQHKSHAREARHHSGQGQQPTARHH